MNIPNPRVVGSEQTIDQLIEDLNLLVKGQIGDYPIKILGLDGECYTIMKLVTRQIDGKWIAVIVPAYTI